MRYPVVIHKEAGTAYGVTVPDLPGVFTAGDSIEEALANVQEAVEAAFDDEGEIPAPGRIDDHVANPDFAGGVFAYADIDLSRLQGPAIRVNITLPQRDLDLIDRAAQAAGSNRSNFLRDAALALARSMGTLRVAEPKAARYVAKKAAKAAAKKPAKKSVRR